MNLYAFIKKVIRNLSYKFPGGVSGNLLSLYKGRGLGCLYREFGKKAVLDELLFRRYTGNREYCKLKEKLDLIREKNVITVVFQVWNLAKWKCDSVYHAMKKHPRFNPIIWLADEPGAIEAELIDMRNQMNQFFDLSHYSVIWANSWDELDKKTPPDIIFLQDHYPRYINRIPVILNRILCNVRYGLANTNLKESYNYFLSNYAFFNFTENASVFKEQKEILSSKGRNMVITGHPIVDSFNKLRNSKNSVWKNCSKQLKKIIWAPHWTISNDARFCPATFLKYSHFMLELANKYQDEIQIAFKPHPMLYRTLCEHPDWGQKRAEAYYKQWATMHNTQIEEGDYIELFLQSDAIIHDSGSFILEYLIVNKPCMYLQKEKKNAWNPHFNEMNKEALKCYTLGYCQDDIENFIIDIVQDNNDDKRILRHNFYDNYLLPPNSISAADNIINAILG
ncbi:MAG: CDP-glycerol glycerophosphotransferase family protein [Akkermansia sp.]|nr:CDP-glycerol glycerophosphotransferase family protein [Akkermansia sp.]